MFRWVGWEGESMGHYNWWFQKIKSGYHGPQISDIGYQLFYTSSESWTSVDYESASSWVIRKQLPVESDLVQVCTNIKTWKTNLTCPAPLKGPWKHLYVLSIFIVFDNDIKWEMIVFGIVKEKLLLLGETKHLRILQYKIVGVVGFFSCTMQAGSCRLVERQVEQRY